jgi:hypothetical protein
MILRYSFTGIGCRVQGLVNFAYGNDYSRALKADKKRW